MLIAACLFLPLCIAPAVQTVFSQGVSFSGITLAITAPEGDPVPAVLETFLPGMEDVSQYCRVMAMEQADALAQLENGEVSAVLVLPKNFIQGIMDGSNPDVDLIVAADRPLEALLTLWVGQSAADLLSSVQSAIYAVLDLYLENPPADLDYAQVVSQINLRFINWTLNRQELFKLEQLDITGLLPIGLHYSFSLLCFLLLSLAPFFFVAYESTWIRSQNRLRCVGTTVLSCWAASFAACWILLLTITLPANLLISKGNFFRCLLSSGLCSLFCAAFTVFCCTLTGQISSCGLFSSLAAVLLLALSGGIFPPVMLPQTLRSLLDYSPVSWMRSLFGFSAQQCGFEVGVWLLLLILSVLLLLGSFPIYRRRFMQEVSKQ